MQNSETTILTEANNVYHFSPPQAGTSGILQAQNHTETIQEIAVAITCACGAAVKLFATIECVPDIDSANPRGLKPSKVTGEIMFKEVKFSYLSCADVPILKGIDITFPAGKTTALVGASGSGKSTIVSLTECFYNPLSGSVMLDGIDLRELNIKWLRSQISLVSQEPVLFATTIRGNIKHGLIGTLLQ
ncbi:P-loop containing nucleoside triphosphate hydrolase protein [Suillus discolor]|uniref:P-loop containing nucleoside triphosphate hydrolase protein n=1 Tax=Suillus discolor TaxID=1912936 RepID=A0A9P7FD52_9AGAM|nr:P-loop containing nucleoside triphosphate hydrolase protein [Suillus discolor]KAG2112308.1 P-loop containing nucleoside triphosphate hydrolase protein [Suillus discolor]